MGIKDLTVFLKEYAPSSISKGNLSQIRQIVSNKRPEGSRLRAAVTKLGTFCAISLIATTGRQ